MRMNLGIPTPRSQMVKPGHRRTSRHPDPLCPAPALARRYRPGLQILDRRSHAHIKRLFQLVTDPPIGQRPRHRKRLGRRIGHIKRGHRPPFPAHAQPIHMRTAHPITAAQTLTNTRIPPAQRSHQRLGRHHFTNPHPQTTLTQPHARTVTTIGVIPTRRTDHHRRNIIGSMSHTDLAHRQNHHPPPPQKHTPTQMPHPTALAVLSAARHPHRGI